ncbi:MAG: molybdenum cofactor guanylyltransferase MobA, partial [Gammaproteobacteria bacterium]
MATDNITGIILAGGQARRMGGQDKGLIQLCMKPMIEYVLDAIEPQVDAIIINANRNQAIYKAYGFPVVADQIEGYCGPLAGMASGLQVAKTPFVVTVPCDSPLIPDDLVQKLYSTLQDEDAEICTAHSNGRLQPVFTLMKSELLPSMLDFLNNGERKIDKWFEKHHLAITDFSEQP